MASTFLSLPSVSPSAALSVQNKCKDTMKSGTSFQSSFFGKDKQTLFMKTKSHGLSEAFKADTSELKLNLGVGVNRTEELQPYVLKVVGKAENLMLERGENKEYLPIEGLAAFNKAIAELLFGVDNPVIHEQRLCNHKNIFNDARVPWYEYKYYDPKTVGLDFDGMIEDIKAASEGSFVLLHVCAYNPRGINPTPQQWEKIADVI
ncbi:hypothetical protein L2E82_41369 [Cichorium intybus]|uniref:Uncharacterized protein n=1 Tax=Cichorium intybus TaxID=13427 RepID=A0ACB9ANY4_CICIN|nr:hypothetical protein L2E82_41369 [Cichorium intybus]